MGFLRRFLCKIKKVFPLGKVVKIVESNLPEPESVEGFDICGCKPVAMQESIIRFDVENGNGIAYCAAALEAQDAYCTSALEAQAPTNVADGSSVRFVVDSGATHIFVNTLDGVQNLDTSIRRKVKIASGECMESGGSGMFNGLIPVVCMPSFSSNLCSTLSLPWLTWDIPSSWERQTAR